MVENSPLINKEGPNRIWNKAPETITDPKAL